MWGGENPVFRHQQLSDSENRFHQHFHSSAESVISENNANL